MFLYIHAPELEMGTLAAEWKQGEGMMFDDFSYLHGVVNDCGTRVVLYLDVTRWDLRYGLAYFYNFFAWRIGYLIPYMRNAVQRTNSCFKSPESAQKCQQNLIMKKEKGME